MNEIIDHHIDRRIGVQMTHAMRMGLCWLLLAAPWPQLQGQEVSARSTQLWIRAGFVSRAGLIGELAGQYEILIVETRITAKEVIADAMGGYDAGILVGLATTARAFPYHLSATVGIAQTWFDRGRACMRCPENPGIALALALHASGRLTSFLGLGLVAYSNQNHAHPFGGLGLMVEIGKLR